MNDNEESQEKDRQYPVEKPQDPEQGDHMESPEPGHPADETEPAGGLPDRPHEHPEDIAGTTPDQDQSPAHDED